MCNLQVVLQKLREAGLRLKPSKCSFFQRRVGYLGHIVSREGVATDPAKTEKVAAWPCPTSVTEVQRFLGLASYYRRFIRNFAQIAKPLHRLTEKTQGFQWTEQCDDAFRELKQRLTSAPILAFPDFSQTFILDTDASQTGIGAVLSQVQEGRERVVAYASRTLSKAERRYCVTRREVVTYVQHFQNYLLGRRFELRTDHGSLTWLQGFKEPEGQLARWLERLQEFDFKIFHRRGKQHGNADALSRRPCQQCGLAHKGGEMERVEICSVSQKPQADNVSELQLEDDVVGPVLTAKIADQRPAEDRLKGRSREFRQLIQLWDQLVIKEGALCRNYEDAHGLGQHLQLVVPKQSREEILRDIHGGALGGHLGEAKTLSRVKERFYWPGHSEDMKLWCKNCPDCAARKTPAPKRTAPLQKFECGYPMQIVVTDIVGPFPESDQGNTYILVAADYFTRWVEAYAIPNQEATTVANKLVDEMFCRFAIPEQLHSDQGRQFESELVQEVSRILQIHKTRTTPYHPQSDGLVERFNRTLLSMLATTVRGHPWDWENHLRKLCMAYNTSVHPSTGFTPFQLMFGRQARLPMDVVYGSPAHEPRSASQYAAQLKETLEQSYQTIREHSQSEAKRQKEVYSKKVHGNQFNQGDLVWLHSPVVPRGQSRKLHCPWTGPFKVVKRLSDAVYRIQDTRPKRKRSRIVVHFDRLKPCTLNPEPVSEPIRSESKDATTTPQAHGVNLNVDMDEEEDADPANGERDPVIVEPSEELEQDDNLAERRYPARERHPPERFGM
jgi:transposase InsO family protein